MKDIKQKKKEEKRKEMERNVRRSPRVIDIKRFYKESSSSEEERKKTKKAVPKIGSPRKVVWCGQCLLGKVSGLLLLFFGWCSVVRAQLLSSHL